VNPREEFAHLTDTDIRALVRQNRALRLGILAAVERHEEDTMLLNTAITELAQSLKEEPKLFGLRWMRKHRKLDLEGVPFTLRGGK
jgi:hypothetical protein